jgi:ribulose-5-phosphate 4-epimerase/fuculose-1-phosphate aldolase
LDGRKISANEAQTIDTIDRPERPMVATVAKLELPSMRSRVSPEEWQARIELAACYRLAAHFGWAGTNLGTHFSARVPGEGNNFLLNPVGLMFDEITASSLIKVDTDGNKLTESPYRTNRAGVATHGGMYLARSEVNSVFHTHTENGVALSMLECGLLPVSITSMRFYKRIGYYDFKGPGENRGERGALAAALGPYYALVMRNHGLLTVGRSIGEGMVVMMSLEQAIAAQLKAMSTGGKLMIPDESLLDKTATRRDQMNEENNDMNWRTFFRLADRIDPSYRE